MKIQCALMILCVLSLSALPALAFDLVLTGQEEGLKLLTAKDVPENFGRGLPMGPSSLRFLADRLWVADSVAGKFVEYDENGNRMQTITIENGEKYLFADFAFQTDGKGELAAIWAIGSEESHLLKIGLDGKIIEEYATKLLDPSQLEMVGGKYLVVFDKAYGRLVAYDLSGKELWQQQAAGNAFVVQENKDLLFIGLEKEKPVICRRDGETGKVKVLRELPVSVEAQPRLLMLKDGQDLLFSFQIMLEGAEDVLVQVARISLEAAEMETVTIDFPAPFLNRILIDRGNHTFLVNFVEVDNGFLLRLSDFSQKISLENSEG